MPQPTPTCAQGQIVYLFVPKQYKESLHTCIFATRRIIASQATPSKRERRARGRPTGARQKQKYWTTLKYNTSKRGSVDIACLVLGILCLTLACKADWRVEVKRLQGVCGWLTSLRGWCGAGGMGLGRALVGWYGWRTGRAQVVAP